ncbi:ATP-binding protein [Nonomuraea sp. NPDC050556]|uniref:ATP-binding protein n=1 Tax=Nonomuraea sp. NPDC050556 TaxID=3364369 RepID=UPI0037AF74C7
MLPTELTTFVGRTAELKEIKSLLGKARLVTLTGVGGVGKTRLAVRVATLVRRAFPDGVHLVELSGLEDPDLLSRAVVDALHVADQTTRSPEEVLIAHLEGKRLLLVLDGVEHVVDACAGLVEALLKASSGLRVMVAGRQALEIDGEYLVTVQPMSTPDAVELFLARAEAATGDPAAAGDDAKLVERLVERLDLIPLAIELAAVQLRALAIEEVMRRLDDRFRLLDRGLRSSLTRHQTLRAAIGWSHELCTPPERLLWARLAVFRGCFTLEGAEAVCSDEHLPADDILDHVRALVDKSIVIREDTGDGVKYRLLDTVREYGAEWLERLGENNRALRSRHKDFYLHLARANEAAWLGKQQETISVRTRAELDNLRVAFEQCDPVERLELAATLWFFWVGCGQLNEGHHWLMRAINAGTGWSPARMKALWVAGYVCVLLGEPDRATELLRECHRYGDAEAAARAVHRLGCVSFLGDKHDRAVPLFRDALERYERLGLVDCHVLMAKVELGMALTFSGDPSACVRLCAEVRAECTEAGEVWVLSYVDYVEAYAAWSTGDREAATALVRESLRVSHLFNDLIGMVLAVELVALMVAEDGEHENAAMLQGAAARIWRSVGPQLFDSTYFNASHDICAKRATDALGRRAYTAAHARGQRLTVGEIVARATGGTAASRQSPVSRREWQVAELVAEGLSNKEIAEKLVVSKRTADAHVGHILAKLGFASRAQIAAWVIERRGA